MYEKREMIIFKIFVASLLQTFCFAMFVFWLIKILSYPSSFGSPLDIDSPNLPAYIQAQRVWTLFFGSLFFFSSMYLFYKSLQLDQILFKRFFVFSLSLFSFLNLIIAIIMFKREHVYQYWKHEMNSQNNVIYMLSFASFIKLILGKPIKDKKKGWINLLAYLLLAFCITALVFNLIVFDKDPSDIYKLSNYYIFSKWMYFTQLTNTACLFYLIFFLVFQKSAIVRNNNFKILIMSHIVVVSTIYLMILLPALFFIKKDSGVQWYDIISATNQHAIIPVLFVTLFVIILKKEKTQSINFIYIAKKGILYPLWYAIFIYMSSFVCRYSPYFVLTNINPNMIIYGTNLRGSYFNALFFIPIILWFNLWFFTFWALNMKFCNISIKYAIKNHFWFIKENGPLLLK